MKAEHRKELQTNSLADFLGRTVRNVRGGSGVSWTKIIIAAAVVFGIAAVFWVLNNQKRTNAELWMKLQANTLSKLEEMAQDKDLKNTKQGQAARFTVAHEYLWIGIQRLGNPTTAEGGLRLLAQGEASFQELAEDCKDEPDRLAEAKYNLAVCKETEAIFKVELLDEAKKLYEDLAKGSLSKTAFGMMAAKRLEQLNADYAAISKFYSEFSTRTMGGLTGAPK